MRVKRLSSAQFVVRSMRKLFTTICLALGICATSFVGANGQDESCGESCAPCTKKVCKLVEEERKVEVVCWGCKCEDFCVPGPGCPKCEHCKRVCPNCDEGTENARMCAQPKRFFWYDWITCRCPQMYTRTKLMKRVEVVKVPTYKWVVEEVPVCDCGDACGCDEAVATDAPPLPKPSANVKAK